MILWGPPGTGKTSIARLLADSVGMRYEAVSAVFSGVADLKKAFAAADKAAEAGQRTLLFVDEIHRFNRAQQDGFLPFVERGTVTLVGATTENPSFELNAALLSRTQVLILHRLDAEALGKLLDRAEELEGPLPLTAEARAALIASADGDGRFLLNQAETLYNAKIDEPLGPGELGSFLQRRVAVYDKDREGHYNLISALHKAVRGSDPQAALYYLARMLTAGEEPLFLARRLVRMAVEDIGLADPNALVQCNAAREAYEFLGSRRRANWRSCRPASTSPPRPNRTPSTRRKRLRSDRERDGQPDAADEHRQRADQADEGCRLRQGLHLRSRCGRRVFRRQLLARRHGAADLLRTRRTRVRAQGARAIGLLGQAARGAVITRFRQYLAIDWSGAAGERHAGIALAVADAAGGAPVLVERGRKWSRSEVLEVLRDLPADTLVGMDLGIALPFADCGAYFPAP